MLIGHKYRLYPDEFQSEVLKLWIGHQRFIYNSKVHEQNYWYTFYKKSLSLTGQSYSPDQSYSQFRNKELTPWLDLAPPEILRNGCYRYMSGYQRFRKNLADVPVVKSKYGKQSVLITNELFYFHDSNKPNSKNHTLFIGNDKFLVGNIQFKVNKNNNNKLNNKNQYDYNIPKSITISLEPSGQWFLSFNSEEIVNNKDNKINDKSLTNIEPNIKRTEEELLYEYAIKSNKEDFIIGIDRGVKIPIATSSGKTYCLDNINQQRIAKKEIKIKRFQRKLARQKLKAKLNRNGFKISHNQVKTKIKIGKLKAYVNNTNHDFSHKTSRSLINDEKINVYVLEDLKVTNMTKSPKPKLVNNDVNKVLNLNNNLSNKNKETNSKLKYLPNGARAKAGLNKSILSSNMGRIKQQLQYKAVKANKLVLFVNPMFSSQECSVCHHIDSNNRLNQSEFKCVKCGYTDNADFNASKIIQYRGIQKLNTIEKDIITNTYIYKPKSKKTVNFKTSKDKKISNSSTKVNGKNKLVGQGLPDFKPDENLSVSVNSNDLIVLNSLTQETPTTNRRF